MIPKLFLSIVLTTFWHGYTNSDERIYGGTKIDITEAPYMVHVAVVQEKYDNGTAKIYSCGGTILRKNLILTAAHCKLKTLERLD